METGMEAALLSAPHARRQEARRSAREHVIRRVQVIAEGRHLEGIMLDVSARGARLQLGETEGLAGEFYMRAADGTVQKVARRWAQGRQMGVEFVGSASVDDLLPPPRTAPADIRHAIRSAPVQEVLSLLARSGHYGDDTLRTASRDLVAALDRVDRALQSLAPLS